MKARCCCSARIIIVTGYSEANLAETQYWAFWKTMQCNDTDAADAIIANLEAQGVVPLHPIDGSDQPDEPPAPTSAWCASAPWPPGPSWAWQQADKTGPTDTFAECPGEEAGYVPVTVIIFFLLTWVLSVPLHSWLVVALWQTASEKPDAYPPKSQP